MAPLGPGAFNEVAYLMRGHAVLLDPLDDEGFYRPLISYFLDRNLEKDSGSSSPRREFLSVGGNEANGATVGPDYFRRYVLEYEVRLIDALHGCGGRAIYHNCGRAALLLPILARDRHGCLRIADAAAFWRHRSGRGVRIMQGMRLMGGIDQIEFLRKATPAMVRRHIAEMARIAATRPLHPRHQRLYQ